MTRHVDVAIVGGTTGALVTAALCAKRGLRTVVFPQGELEGTKLGLFGTFWPADDRSVVLELVHSELGIQHEIRRLAISREPNFQVVFPHERMGWPCDSALRNIEMDRVWGESQAREASAWLEQGRTLEHDALGFIADVAMHKPDGFFGRRHREQTKKAFYPLTEALSVDTILGPLSSCFATLLPFIQHLSSGRPRSRATTIPTLLRVLRGLCRFSGPSMPDQLLQVATRAGATKIDETILHVDATERLIQIHCDNSDNGDNNVTADALVDATSDLFALGAIHAKGHARHFARILDAATPREHLYGLCVEVDRHAMPSAMCDLVLIQPTTPSLPADGATLLDNKHEAVVLLESETTEDRTRWVALVPVRVATAHGRPSQKIADNLMARIEALAPFVADGHPRIIHARDADEGAIPIAHPFFDPSAEDPLALGAVTTRTPFRNVVLAGPAVFSGLGLEGAYLAALEATEAVETALSKKPSRRYAERLLAGVTRMQAASTPPRPST